MWELGPFVPLGIVVLVFGWIHFLLWRDAKKNAIDWDEEEKRQHRVKDLYPEPQSYEERMGVRYGPKQHE